MARLIRYVNTASTAGGDGTTNGTVGATRAYALLSEAITALAQDLTGIVTETCTINGYDFPNIALEIRCDKQGGDNIETAQILTNQAAWVLDSTHRLLIHAYSNSRPSNCQLGTGFTVTSSLATTAEAVISIDNPMANSLDIEGMTFSQTHATAASYAMFHHCTHVTTAKNQYVNCIFSVASNSASAYCVRASTRHARFVQCRFTGSGAWHVYQNGAGVSAGHEFIYCLGDDSNRHGVYADTSVDGGSRHYGWISFNNVLNDYDNTSAWTFLAAEDNASEDATATNPPWGTEVVTGLSSSNFVDSASGDFRPVSGQSHVGIGVDPVTLGFMANRIDANGNPRPSGDTWTLGPLEVVIAAGGGLVNPLTGKMQAPLRGKLG